MREAHMLPKGVAAFNALVRTMKRNAATRNLKWRLTDGQVALLTKQLCHYCGAAPSQTHNRKTWNGNYIYNGLDRADNTKGYTVDNVVPCCKVCNGAKGTMTVEEFRLWAVRLHGHFIEDGVIIATNR